MQYKLVQCFYTYNIYEITLFLFVSKSRITFLRVFNFQNIVLVILPRVGNANIIIRPTLIARLLNCPRTRNEIPPTSFVTKKLKQND